MTSMCNMKTVSFFSRLLRIAPAQPPGHLERGSAALLAGRLDDALAAFDRALADAETPRERGFARNKRSLVSLAQGDRAGAAAELEAALAEYAACVPAMVNLGNLALEAGDVAAAVTRYEVAITLDPDYPEAHHNLGVAYHKLGRRGEAVRELRHATRLEGRRKKTSP